MYNLLFVCVFCSIVGLSYCSGGGSGPRVTIGNGQLEGIYSVSRSGRSYAAFMGIPYANQPEKFEVAHPASNWTGIREVSEFGSVCPQLDPRIQKIVGAEDCLFVNVFTPNLKPAQGLSVLAFIHGGGFQFGNSDENGPEYLMDEDVVFVTFNYRLAAYGFLTTEDEVLPPNLGLKDQVLALKWIQNNIGHFGGNPLEVTLCGESAGAASVGLHIVSPLSRGLFRSAILSSGTSLNVWTLGVNATETALQFAQNLNCPASSSEEIKACLKTKTLEEILTPQESGLSTLQFTSIVEPSGILSPFLPADPRALYEKGEFAKVPLLVTTNSDEGLSSSAAIMKNEAVKQYINNNWYEVAPTMFMYSDPKYTEEVKNKISEEILKFYFSNNDPIITDETFQNLTNAFTDPAFLYSARDLILTHAGHGIDVYAAILSFDGIWSQIFDLGYTECIGMAHADDLQYVFTDVRYPTFVPGSDTFAASRSLVLVYTNFAKFGNPNSNQETKEWKPVGAEELSSKVIDWMYFENREQKIETNLLKSRIEFWDEMYALLDASASCKSYKTEL